MSSGAQKVPDIKTTCSNVEQFKNRNNELASNVLEKNFLIFLLFFYICYMKSKLFIRNITLPCSREKMTCIFEE